MGFRFSRRIKIMPGVRLNVGLRGASLSLGPRGASVTVGRNGTHANIGLPGTGLSYRTRLDSKASRPRRPTPDAAPVPARDPAPVPGELRVRFGPGAALALLDAEGFVLGERDRAAAVKAYRPQLLNLLDAHAAEVSQDAAQMLDVHLGTPAPGIGLAAGRRFAPTKPLRPQDPREIDPASPGRASAEDAWSDYMANLASWRAAKAEHEKLHGPCLPGSDATLAAVEARIAGLSWPRETLVSLEMAGDGRLLRTDVDLPELEHMPISTLAVNRRDVTLVEKPVPDSHRRRLYQRHVHAILFRIIGEAFAAAPAVGEVRIAGYTQRPSRATGSTEDEYVLSVRVERADWSAIAFDNPAAIDPASALARFERRCSIDSAGHMRPIEPSI